MASEAEQLAEFIRAFGEPEQDAGPEARRARAGMPPGPRDMTSADFEPQFGRVPQDVPNLAGKSLIGTPSQFGEVGRMPQRGPNTPPDPERFRAGPPRPSTELEGDPGMQAMTAAAMLRAPFKTGPGASFGAAARNTLGRAAAPLAGATEGAGVAAMMGARPKDIGIAAAFGGAFGALGAGRAATLARQDQAAVRQIGRLGTENEQLTIANIGKDRVAKVARDYGIVEAPGIQAKSQAALAAKRKVGEELGTAYEPLAAHPAPTRGVVEALEQVKAEVGKTTEGQKLIGVIQKKQEALQKLYGDNIPLDALNREITELESLGFSGKARQNLSERAAARLQRSMAGAMENELQTALGQAKKNPQLAPAVDRIGELNPTYRSLIVVNDILDRQAGKQFSKPTIGERFEEAPGTTVSQVAARAATAPLRGAGWVMDRIGASGPEIQPGAAVGAAAARPERKLAPAAVPVIKALQDYNSADLTKQTEAAVFGP